MKRNLMLASLIMSKLTDAEDKGKGPIEIRFFLTEEISARHVAMLVNAGFIVKVEIPDNDHGIDYFRSTWKGQCFLDLYETYLKHDKKDFDEAKAKGIDPSDNVSLLTATYHAALLSFY